MTVTHPPLPNPLPELPPVPKRLEAQIHTHTSSVSTTNPTPYNRLMLLGNASLQAAITRILFEYSENWEPGTINDLRNFYVSTVNVGLWGRAYGFDRKLNIASNLLPSLADEKLHNKYLASTFQAYLGGALLNSSQEHVNKFIAKLLTPALATMGDPKSTADVHVVQTLHERLTRLDVPLPAWPATEDSDEDITTRFEVKCIVNGKIVAKAKGKSKAEGKRKAAALAMDKPDRVFLLREVRREE